MATHPEDRPIHLANVFVPLHARRMEDEDDDRRAHEVLHRVENLLQNELPRVADTLSAVMKGLEAELDEANREIARLRQENAEFQAKIDAIQELKRALARL